MCHPQGVSEDLGVGTEEVTVPLGPGEGMPATLYRPEGDGGQPILVIGDIYGRTGFYRWISARLATAGYVALLPDYFHRLGEPEPASRDAAFARYEKLDEVACLEDLRAALDWVDARFAAPGTTIGVLGFCLGGTLGLNLAMSRADLPLVAFYAFPRGVQAPCARKAPAPIEHTSSIRGRVLAFWGDADYISVEEISEFGTAMADAPADYEAVVYPGAGHGFLGDLAGAGAGSSAAEAAWKQTLAFYSDTLRAA